MSTILHIIAVLLIIYWVYWFILLIPDAINSAIEDSPLGMLIPPIVLFKMVLSVLLVLMGVLGFLTFRYWIITIIVLGLTIWVEIDDLLGKD